jgi:hypothetical protein
VDVLTVATTFICDKCYLTISESMVRPGEAKRTAGERGTSMSNPEVLRLPNLIPVPEVAKHLVCTECGVSFR